jgi:hypothetical protein
VFFIYFYVNTGLTAEKGMVFINPWSCVIILILGIKQRNTFKIKGFDAIDLQIPLPTRRKRCAFFVFSAFFECV